MHLPQVTTLLACRIDSFFLFPASFEWNYPVHNIALLFLGSQLTYIVTLLKLRSLLALLPPLTSFTDEETEVQRGEGICPRSHC